MREKSGFLDGARGFHADPTPQTACSVFGTAPGVFMRIHTSNRIMSLASLGSLSLHALATWAQGTPDWSAKAGETSREARGAAGYRRFSGFWELLKADLVSVAKSRTGRSQRHGLEAGQRNLNRWRSSEVSKHLEQVRRRHGFLVLNVFQSKPAFAAGHPKTTRQSTRYHGGDFAQSPGPSEACVPGKRAAWHPQAACANQHACVAACGTWLTAQTQCTGKERSGSWDGAWGFQPVDPKPQPGNTRNRQDLV